MKANTAMTHQFDLVAADLPDPSRANDEALHLVSDLLRAKSAQDVEGTMRFFSRGMVAYADATLGMTFPNWDALRDAYASMMPGWGTGQSYPLMVWGDVVDGQGSALVHLIDTPEMFGGEARIFASIEVREGAIVRWVDYWDSRGFNDTSYAALRKAGVPFPPHFGEHNVQSSAPVALVKAAETLHACSSPQTPRALDALLHPDVIFEDIALATSLRGAAAVASYLKSTASSAPFGVGAQLRHVVGGARGGAYEWRASNGRPGITGIAIDTDGKVLRVVAAYDHRAFAL